jgi:ubiquinone/menaquinone biosynthesis C-methylase UbiE
MEAIAPSEPQGFIHGKVPWWAKIAAKIVLSRLGSLAFWQQWNLFRAGQMQDQQFAEAVLNVHLQRAGIGSLANKTVLELGPGNGLLTGKLAAEMGASHTWLIDSEPLAKDQPLPPRTTYLWESPAGLAQIPDGSVDFLFSHAVLEHVSKRDFQFLLQETYRVLKPDGVASHGIDFQDHLQYALNNLRFSERVWESRFMSQSGFYTNRIPWPQMEKVFKDCGFSVQVINFLHWANLPTPQRKMAEPFCSMPADELMVKGANVVLRKK